MWRQYYSDGKLAFEGKYIDGLESGEHKYFYPDGTQREQRMYRLGEPDGTWKMYDQTGTLSLEIEYKNGKEVKIDNQDTQDEERNQ